jgi:hypothetical protein
MLQIPYCKTETLKLLEKNIEEPLQHIDIGYNFLKKTPIAQEIIARTDK